MMSQKLDHSPSTVHLLVSAATLLLIWTAPCFLGLAVAPITLKSASNDELTTVVQRYIFLSFLILLFLLAGIAGRAVARLKELPSPDAFAPRPTLSKGVSYALLALSLLCIPVVGQRFSTIIPQDALVALLVALGGYAMAYLSRTTRYQVLSPLPLGFAYLAAGKASFLMTLGNEGWKPLLLTVGVALVLISCELPRALNSLADRGNLAFSELTRQNVRLVVGRAYPLTVACGVSCIALLAYLHQIDKNYLALIAILPLGTRVTSAMRRAESGMTVSSGLVEESDKICVLFVILFVLVTLISWSSL